MKGTHQVILVVDFDYPLMWHKMISPDDVKGPVDPKHLELAPGFFFDMRESPSAVVSEVMPCRALGGVVIEVGR